MTDYSKSVIYTIKTSDGLYVGSTTNFYDREIKHRNSIYNKNDKNYNYKLYQNIRNNDGKYDMIIHKHYPCKNNIELRKEEEKVRKELSANLNMRACHRGKWEGQKEYYKNNKDKCKEYGKEYYENNKVKLSEKITCQCGSNIRRGELSRHRKSKKHIAVCG